MTWGLAKSFQTLSAFRMAEIAVTVSAKRSGVIGVTRRSTVAGVAAGIAGDGPTRSIELDIDAQADVVWRLNPR